MEDGQIVQLYRSRDESAIRQTAEKYGSRLRAIALHITGDRETAEECENDTYLETWNRIPPSDPGEYFFAFLARITRARSVDRCRERMSLKRSGYVVELSKELEDCLPAANDAADDVEARLLGEAISGFLLTLSEEKQVMFVRRYFYLDTVPEIAARLSVSVGKVKTALFRIRKELREHLIREGYTV